MWGRFYLPLWRELDEQCEVREVTVFLAYWDGILVG